MSPVSDNTISSHRDTPSSTPIPYSSTRSKSATVRPHPKPAYPVPKLRIECRDLNHDGAEVFFSQTIISSDLAAAVSTAPSILYEATQNNSHIPPTRSVSLFLHSFNGVAYTAGSELDDDHKEIHFSLDYIDSISQPRQQDEIQGVLVHEMVHCWQWNALGTCPSGLVEGIADFVRLKAGLSPPHWKKERGGEWDAGYQHTAYFLDWIEGNWGKGSVRRINESMMNKRYIEDEFWRDLFGIGVKELWTEYSNTLPENEELSGKDDDRQNTQSPCLKSHWIG
ncbi:MAG: hypothetical protein LQ342_004136 [Letrouitia transgressa]|nr:MAG: hypothetical protein LQ342_004136 [Letrouitia transgressa]